MKPDEALETVQDQLTPFDPSLYGPDIETSDVPVLLNFDPHGRSPYSDEQRREAVTVYLTTGNALEASRQTGIPYRTLKDWTKTEWWESVAANVRQMVTNQVRGKISACLMNGLDQTLERLENGDETYVRGELKRVKVRARDAAVIVSIMSDKLAQSLNAPTLARVDGKVEVLADQLERLSAQVNARTINP